MAVDPKPFLGLSGSGARQPVPGLAGGAPASGQSPGAAGNVTATPQRTGAQGNPFANALGSTGKNPAAADVTGGQSLQQGGTIWGMVAARMPQADAATIQKKVGEVLQMNGLSWDGARRLPVGFNVQLPGDLAGAGNAGTANTSRSAVNGASPGVAKATLTSAVTPIPNAGAVGTSSAAKAAPAVQSSGSTPVDQAVDQAVAILEQNGVAASKLNKDAIKTIIQHESGGNPNAINLTDSNAKKGTPSIGLLQTIQPTFDANKLPGFDNIRNPVDNIIAGVRYALGRYGSLDNVPGIVALSKGLPYVGY